MEYKTVKKYNKMIADFMNVEYKSDDDYINTLKEMHKDGVAYQQRCYMVSDLKYHEDWNWLMPVVSKCLEVYHIELMNDDFNFDFYGAIGSMYYTYNAVIEFIIEYKNQ
tara:strand:- start:516 stop:842 length:327 start_codon:yes stop_codon:yes gene_type:complete